jgi:hypothetical protein
MRGGRVVALATALLAGRADQGQWRPAVSVRLYTARRFDFTVYQENWLVDEGPNPAQFQLSGRLRYHPLDHLALGLNYTYADSRTATPDSGEQRVHQDRLEFEANPHWEWPSGWRLSNRNRLEVRWIENQADVNYRSRHLLEVAWPIRLPRPLQSTFTSAEVFYDWSRGRLPEWRVSPVGVDLALHPRASLRLYYTYRENQVAGDWQTSHVFWTVLNFRLH